MSFKTVLVDLICSIPDDLQRRAERRRAIVYGYREELRREGLPEAYVDRQGALDLAVADFYDALAGHDTPPS